MLRKVQAHASTWRSVLDHIASATTTTASNGFYLCDLFETMHARHVVFDGVGARQHVLRGPYGSNVLERKGQDVEEHIAYRFAGAPTLANLPSYRLWQAYRKAKYGSYATNQAGQPMSHRKVEYGPYTT